MCTWETRGNNDLHTRQKPTTNTGRIRAVWLSDLLLSNWLTLGVVLPFAAFVYKDQSVPQTQRLAGVWEPELTSNGSPNNWCTHIYKVAGKCSSSGLPIPLLHHRQHWGRLTYYYRGLSFIHRPEAALPVPSGAVYNTGIIITTMGLWPWMISLEWGWLFWDGDKKYIPSLSSVSFVSPSPLSPSLSFFLVCNEKQCRPVGCDLIFLDKIDYCCRVVHLLLPSPAGVITQNIIFVMDDDYCPILCCK